MKEQTRKEKNIRRMIRRNKSYREDKYNIGGTKKDNVTAPPITLPKFKCMEGFENDEDK